VSDALMALYAERYVLSEMHGRALFIRRHDAALLAAKIASRKR